MPGYKGKKELFPKKYIDNLNQKYSKHLDKLIKKYQQISYNERDIIRNSAKGK